MKTMTDTEFLVKIVETIEKAQVLLRAGFSDIRRESVLTPKGGRAIWEATDYTQRVKSLVYNLYRQNQSAHNARIARCEGEVRDSRLQVILSHRHPDRTVTVSIAVRENFLDIIRDVQKQLFALQEEALELL